MQQTNLFETDLKLKDPVSIIEPQILRKINLLTLKDRPFCCYCNAKCGFSWYLHRDYTLCITCFQSKNFPEGVSELDFTLGKLDDYRWERLTKDLTPDMEQAAKAKSSHLTKEQQD
jgi:hypothetical protein